MFMTMSATVAIAGFVLAGAASCEGDNTTTPSPAVTQPAPKDDKSANIVGTLTCEGENPDPQSVTIGTYPHDAVTLYNDKDPIRLKFSIKMESGERYSVHYSCGDSGTAACPSVDGSSHTFLLTRKVCARR